MTPDELPAFLDGLTARIATAAPDVARAMAEAYEDRVVKVELHEAAHPPGTWTNAPPGRPPAWVTGELARSMVITPLKRGGMEASNLIGPTAVYARIQELGGDIRPDHHRYLHWVREGKDFWSQFVELPPRPYMRPALTAVISDGSLRRAAALAFVAHVWGA